MAEPEVGAYYVLGPALTRSPIFSFSYDKHVVLFPAHSLHILRLL